MTKLPEKNLLEGTKEPETTTGEFRLAMGNLRQFIADLLGTDSADKQDARDVFGVQEKYRAEAEGTADALTAGFAPPVLLPLNGMHVQVRAKAANTTATPTFRADETSALPIVKGNNLPLEIGDIAGDGHWLELKYDGTFGKWVLENPAFGVSVMPVVNEKADHWEVMAQLSEKLDKAEKLPVGTIVAIGGNITPAGFLYCNGASLSASAYPELCAVIGGTYGGDGLTNFRLPDFRGRWMQGNDTAGRVLGAGLPNITGHINSVMHWQDPGVSNTALSRGPAQSGQNWYEASSYQCCYQHVLDASRSSPIYGASNTVQPPSLTVRYCIKY